MSAICVNRLLSPPVNHTPTSALSNESGTISTTASGSVQLLYWAARMR